jgi:squalene-associated FAD-dependent desaturase
MTDNISPKVCIIGGGIAGLSAAVFLVNEGVNVTLIEASPKFGGRAYSFFDKSLNEYIDNGQHILASWYNNTFDFLRIIGSIDNIKEQDTLEISFADSNGKKYELKCPDIPPPFHLIKGIFGYKAVGLKEKTGIVKLMNAVTKDKFSDEELKAITTADLFRLTNQGENLIRYFWEPFIIAVFNAEPEETCAWYFTEMIKTGFLKKGGSNLVFPLKGLNELYVNKSIEYLKSHDVNIISNCSVKKLNIKDNLVTSVIAENDEEMKFDYYVSAVPFFDFESMIDNELFNNQYHFTRKLKPSTIINVHLKYEIKNGSEISIKDFTGILNSTIQWVFKTGKNQLCLVISSANRLAGKSKEELIATAIEELERSLPEFQNAEFIYARVVKEKRATFLPDIESVKSRPANKTGINNFFITGDWTDTGLPATIESAVLSSKKCTKELLETIKNK